jgi:hypothetical protein
MKTFQADRVSQRGVALLTALGLLFVFSMLGAAYLAWTTIEGSSVDLELQALRARNVARTGLQIAIAEIQASLAANKPVPSAIEREMPVLAPRPGDPVGFAPAENIKGALAATIVPEGPAQQFRITSQGVITPQGKKGVQRIVEAIVLFGQGAPQTLFATETPDKK